MLVPYGYTVLGKEGTWGHPHLLRAPRPTHLRWGRLAPVRHAHTCCQITVGTLATNTQPPFLAAILGLCLPLGGRIRVEMIRS